MPARTVGRSGAEEAACQAGPGYKSLPSYPRPSPRPPAHAPGAAGKPAACPRMGRTRPLCSSGDARVKGSDTLRAWEPPEQPLAPSPPRTPGALSPGSTPTPGSARDRQGHVTRPGEARTARVPTWLPEQMGGF